MSQPPAQDHDPGVTPAPSGTDPVHEEPLDVQGSPPAKNGGPNAPAEPRPFRGPSFRWIAAITLTLLALVGLTSYQIGRAGDVPPENGADVGFARDMQTHHNQAVQMAFIIRDKTSDPTLRAVAYDIATSQQQQAGQMYGWLAHWGLPMTSTEPPMTWMTTDQHQPEDRPAPQPSSTPAGAEAGAGAGAGDTMSSNGQGMIMGSPAAGATTAPGTMDSMGMASDDQLRALQSASGVAAERQFLTLMIAHHQGGVTMAQAALRLAKKPEVLTLAQAIDTAQQAEIRQLKQLLQQRS